MGQSVEPRFSSSRRRSWFRQQCLNGASTYSLMVLSPSGRGTVRLTSPIGLLGGVSFGSGPRGLFALLASLVSTFLGLLLKVLDRGLSGAVTSGRGFDGVV